MRISDWSSDVCSSDLAAGADFAYLFATDGDARVDPTYARNMAAAREAGIRTGPIHRYNLCKLATRSDESRVGKECVGTCNYRWSQSHSRNKKSMNRVVHD